VTLLGKAHDLFLSEPSRRWIERWVLGIATASFILHLVLIFIHTQIVAVPRIPPELLANPIAAIYTPFSFILVYEVYLLIFYLPQSITRYIGKQYEIITLIVIRRIFKDIANLELTADWFRNEDDLQFTFDCLATLVLFLLIYWFYLLDRKRVRMAAEEPEVRVQRFVVWKRQLSTLLVPILFGLAVYSLGSWLYEVVTLPAEQTSGVSDINRIFFDDFFTVLIMTDVLLLLISFLHTDHFPIIIRNSGFVITTILLKVSFAATGLLNVALIVGAVAFGVAILWIFNRYASIPDERLKGV